MSVIPWYFWPLATPPSGSIDSLGLDWADVVVVEEVKVPLELSVAEIAVERDETSDEAMVSVSDAEPDGVAVGVADIVHYLNGQVWVSWTKQLSTVSKSSFFERARVEESLDSGGGRAVLLPAKA